MKTGKELKDFCDDFAYEFITSCSVTEEFRNLTGSDMREIMISLKNHLHLDLRDWLDDRRELNDDE